MKYDSEKEIREARAKAHTYAVSLLSKESTPENKRAYDKAMTDVDNLTRDLVTLEKAKRGEQMTDRSTPWANPKEHNRAAAFGRFLRYGDKKISAEDRALIEQRDEVEGTLLSQVGTYSGLGYFVPAGFVYDIEQATKYFAPLLDGSVVRILETKSGQPLPYPTSNDTSQVATLVGEGASVSEQDVTANHITFSAYKYSSGLVKCSMELIQDSAFDLEAWLSERFGERFGRGMENAFTNGTGVSQPTGLITAILASGATPIIAAGSAETTGGSQTGANSIGYSDLVNLEHSVDPTYRRGAKYMFHDQTLSALKRIIDKYGRPLWVPGISVGEADRINGYPYVINQSMPQIGSAANTVIFGDFSKFIVRKVQDLIVQRLDELFAVTGQIGYISFARVDSLLIDAGTHPLNLLEQHS